MVRIWLTSLALMKPGLALVVAILWVETSPAWDSLSSVNATKQWIRDCAGSYRETTIPGSGLHVTTVDLNWRDFRGKELQPLGKLPHLRELTLYQADLTGVRLDVLKRCSHLKKLDLSYSRIDSRQLRHLATLQELEELTLGGDKIEEVDWAYLCSRIPQLRKLTLNRLHLTERHLASLGQLTRLETLDLTLSTTTDRGLAHLRPLVLLKELNLEATKVTGAGMVHLKPLVGLTRLEVSWLQLGPSDLVILKDLPRLEEIRMGDPWEAEKLVALKSLRHLSFRIRPIKVDVLAKLLAVLKLESVSGLETSAGTVGLLRNHPSLTGLSIDGPIVTDEFLTQLTGNAKQLQHLGIGHQTALTDKGLRTLGDLPRLRTLIVDVLSDHVLAGIQTCNQLEELHARATPRVTDKGLELLSTLPRLRELALTNSKVSPEGVKALSRLASLQHLRLWGTPVTDDWLPAFGAMRNLRFLDVSSSTLTDARLTDLATLVNLNTLVLGKGVTETGAARLRKCLPGVQIIGAKGTPSAETHPALIME